MKPEPVFVNFIPEDGNLEFWIGNECLILTDFLTGTVTKTDKVVHTRVLTEEQQKKLIKALVNNLLK
jgi:hypothetical protein